MAAYIEGIRGRLSLLGLAETSDGVSLPMASKPTPQGLNGPN